MDRLYQLIKRFNIEDAIKIEFEDKQFLALKKLYDNKKFSDEIYLFLIILNSIVSYQLSWKGEDRWEEFSEALISCRLNIKENIYSFFEKLLKEGKNNKRFVNFKLNRITKAINFWEKFKNKSYQYYEDMIKLAQDLASFMNQKIDDKTIVFAVKMFWYGARLVYGKINIYPYWLMIPLDSRLKQLYELNFWQKDNEKVIKQYYLNLSHKLNIPPLHLDSILWVKFSSLKEELK